MSEKLRIIFMGTPEFAVASLKKLLDNNAQVVAVITSPDKPAGRGQKISFSPVKDLALKKDIPLLQPTNLKDPSFLHELKSYNADIQIVVAFRMLPKEVWDMPANGTFNLHASYLPDYRGAAPINWVLINGEKYTGLTTFFLNEHIDTGEIIIRKKMPIQPDENASSLHDRLMIEGADLVIETLQCIQKGNCEIIPQNSIVSDDQQLKTAPKLQKEHCRIDWEKSANDIYNFIRGLSYYPGAFTEIISPAGKRYLMKTTASNKEIIDHSYKTGDIFTDQKKYLKVAVPDGYIYLTEIQLSGKRRMDINSFLQGFAIDNSWKIAV